MRFINGEDMYDCLKASHDLYNPEKELYVFLYNSADSICYYYIDAEEAEELERLSKENDDYWAAFLGAGGWIIDPPEYECYVEGSETPTEWCEDNYDGEWRLV